MQHRFHAVQGTLHGGAIADVADLEFGAFQRSWTAIPVNIRSKRIEHAYFVAAIEQFMQHMSPNKSDATCQENAHFRRPPSRAKDRTSPTVGNRQKPSCILPLYLISPFRRGRL